MIGFDAAEEMFQSLVAAGNSRVKVLLDPRPP